MTTYTLKVLRLIVTNRRADLNVRSKSSEQPDLLAGGTLWDKESALVALGVRNQHETNTGVA
jgi:hypothetical protein